MATISSNGTGGGSWSSTSTWNGGSLPGDGDEVIVVAGDAVLMDTDTSAMTGLQTVTITGVASGTPGKLYFAAGTSGYLKLRPGYHVTGTDHAVYGQLVANNDGALATTTALPFVDKAIIELGGATQGYLDARWLDINLRCTEPTNTYVETYGTAYGPADQSTDVDTSTDVIDWGEAPPSANTAVRVKSSGTLPGGLSEDMIYYAYNVSGNTCQLVTQSNVAATLVDITSVGSGNLTLYSGHTSTATKTMNVVQDVTGDAQWAANAKVVLCNIGPVDYDQQRDKIASTTSSTVVFTNTNVDSAQYPCSRIWLAERNVAIRSNSNSTSHSIVYQGTSGYFGCEISAILNWDSRTATTFYCYGIYSGTSHTISGTVSGCNYGTRVGTSNTISGTVSGCSNGIYDETSQTISGTVSGCNYGIRLGTSYTISGTVSGCSRGISEGTSHTISGTVSGCSNGIYSGTSHTISGTISGCSNGIYSGTSHTISGTISGCDYGIYSGTFTSQNAVVTGNTYDIRQALGIAYGTVLSSASQVHEVTQAIFPYNGTNPLGVVSYDPVNGTQFVGAIESWNQGGTIDSAAYVSGTHGSMPAGWDGADPDYIMTAACDSTATPTGATDPPLWVELPAIQGVDGETINWQCAVKLDQTTNWTTRPTLQLIDKRYPWMHASEVVDDAEATSTTDWQLLTVSVACTADQQLAVRIIGEQVATNSNGWKFCWRQVLDYPAEEDVENGVDYGNAAYTGTLAGGGGGGSCVIIGG